MNKFLSMGVGLVLLGSALAAEAADAITGNVTLASDYRFRGISQLQGGGYSPAIQGGFDWKPESGFYLGTWASNVNFSPGSIEVDLYGGYGNKINDNVSYDFGFYYYGYPNDGTHRLPPTFNNRNLAYYEYYADMSAYGFKVGVNYSPDYFEETGDFQYWYGEYSTKVADKVTLGAHLGYNHFDQKLFLGNRDYYWDWKLSAAIDGFGVTWTLAYVATNLENKEECFGQKQFCEATAVFSISKAL